jgi:hypothetical protein
VYLVAKMDENENATKVAISGVAKADLSRHVREAEPVTKAFQ